MRRRFVALGARALLMLGCSLSTSVAQTISGVADRGQYTDRVTYTVAAEAGFVIAATLNGAPVPVGVPNLIERMDFYELIATRTPAAGGLTTSNVVRFIVLFSSRGDPERGLIEWTPYPSIPSTAAEFNGAHLDLIVPRDYPPGLEIPVVAWVRDHNGDEVRGNGSVVAAGFPNQEVRIRRGAGSGLLPPATAPGELAYEARLHEMANDKTITIDSTTAWTPVSGPLPGSTLWPANARIHLTGNITIPAGSTLTVEPGAIIKINPRVNITNSGQVIVNGTLNRPVVFTSTNRVDVEVPTYAWGGFVMRGTNASLITHAAILVGGGGATGWSFSPGESHRSEQAVLMVHSGAQAHLTNSAIIHTAGQVANGFESDVTYDHCLLQKAITAGEYVGGVITLNHSALIEFPEENGTVNAAIASADYDAIYFTEGTHLILNTLIGFCKDDAIDSGSGGTGTVLVTNSWIEAALHESMAWSGGGRVAEAYDTVSINSGQGFECGWSTGTDSPLCIAGNLLSLGNSVGTRYGDNYVSIGDNHQGFLRVTNSFVLYNYRDVFGYAWSDWIYHAADMDIHDNFISQANPYHPNNSLWNPAADGWRLEPFLPTTPGAPVGIGLATWSGQSDLARAGEGVPVRLSTFTTQPVSVDFLLQDPSAATLQSGTLTFQPGETVKRIPINIANPTNYEVLRLTLQNPVQGELTGSAHHYLIRTAEPTVARTILLPRNSTWKYHDLGQDLQTAWRDPGYPDGTWASGPGDLGFGDNNEATVINGGPSGARFPTIYFRTTFSVDDPAAFGALEVSLRRDDGGVVYLNGREIFRSNMPGTTITYNTLASGGAGSETDYFLGTASATNLQAGVNTIAVEIHQDDLGSSDLHFDLELAGLPPSAAKTTLITRGEVWKYHDLGQDLQTSWRDLNYVDSSWASGPAELGFGDGGEATVINGGPSGARFPTVYFRKTIQVPDPTLFGSIEFGLRRDDGGVIYINGAEVHRNNMPGGLITYNTFASGTTPSETAYALATTSASYLRANTNVIAVEIHQSDAGSSDLSFDLEMFGSPEPSGPELNVRRFGSTLVLYWLDPTFQLQSCNALGEPWVDGAPASPVEVPTTPAPKFFRLRGP